VESSFHSWFIHRFGNAQTDSAELHPIICRGLQTAADNSEEEANRGGAEGGSGSWQDAEIIQKHSISGDDRVGVCPSNEVGVWSRGEYESAHSKIGTPRDSTKYEVHTLGMYPLY
jgi:hypothetical protein